MFTPEAALTKASEAFYARYPIEAQVVLSGVRDASDVLRCLLDGGHSAIASRLAGAFRHIGRADMADEIGSTMKAVGYDVRESDPFGAAQRFGAANRGGAPIAERLRAMWKRCREPVTETFPKAPGPPEDPKNYIRLVDEAYRSDAYHSLSIEGYRVTPQLIDQVRTGTRDPDNCDAAGPSQDALAARCCWQAFQRIRDTLGEIMAGNYPGAVIRAAHLQLHSYNIRVRA